MLPGKISLRFDGDIKGFYRQAKTKEFRTIKPTLKKKLKGFLWVKMNSRARNVYKKTKFYSSNPSIYPLLCYSFLKSFDGTDSTSGLVIRTLRTSLGEPMGNEPACLFPTPHHSDGFCGISLSFCLSTWSLGLLADKLRKRNFLSFLYGVLYTTNVWNCFSHFATIR